MIIADASRSIGVNNLDTDNREALIRPEGDLAARGRVEAAVGMGSVIQGIGSIRQPAVGALAAMVPHQPQLHRAAVLVVRRIKP